MVHNPTIVKINQLYLIWIILGLAIPTAIEGILTGSSIGAFQGFMWGGIVRIFLFTTRLGASIPLPTSLVATV
ncbi:hypothetical protein [Nostoc flagelliforme]|uniref:hypothetical protein n=1 Tax=Nostoc flagelliforme TaxID=1306274 RepID=UPI001CEC7994|nr:hypothetical protein [Nostoc flagelliforme]